VQDIGDERTLLVAARKQPSLRPSQPPICAQNPQQLRREHDVAILAALALLDPDHHSLAVDVGDLEKNDFQHAQSGGINRGQRGAAFEARDRLQEADDLVSTQLDRQLARLPRIGDALRQGVLTERHAIEEPQRADDLVQRRPRDPRRNQMNLEGVDIFQAKTIRRATK
jgi:hypothetical protein